MSSLLYGALRLSASGPLPVDEVWERYTRPVWWSRWAPHLREVDYPEPVVTPGRTGRVTGVAGRLSTTITEVWHPQDARIESTHLIRPSGSPQVVTTTVRRGITAESTGLGESCCSEPSER